MPQSLTKLYAHLIFSTKRRQPTLDEAIRPRVHAHLAPIIPSRNAALGNSQLLTPRRLLHKRNLLERQPIYLSIDLPIRCLTPRDS
jgi:hypothetical protein